MICSIYHSMMTREYIMMEYHTHSSVVVVTESVNFLLRFRHWIVAVKRALAFPRVECAPFIIW